MRNPFEPQPYSSTSEKLPEQHKKTVIERISSKFEKNKPKEKERETYAQLLQKYKQKHSRLSIDELEKLRANGYAHIPEPLEDRNLEAEFRELSEQFNEGMSQTGKAQTEKPTSKAEYETELFFTPEEIKEQNKEWEELIEIMEEPFPESRTTLAIINASRSIEVAQSVAEAANDEALEKGELGDSSQTRVPGKPYFLRIEIFHPADPSPETGLIVEYSIIPDEPVIENPPSESEEPIDPDDIPELPENNFPKIEDLPIPERPEKEVAAEKDAIDYLYGLKLGEMLRNGEELNLEQKQFIVEQLVDKGLDSAMSDLLAQKNGFTSFQQAAKELKVQSGVYDQQKFLKLPDKVMDRMPASVQNALKSAKFGALTAGGLLAASIFMPALAPVAVASLGGVAGSTIARMMAGYFTRDRAIFGKKKGQDSVAEKAFKGMVSEMAAARENAYTTLEELKNGELDQNEIEAEYAKLLNGMVEQQFAKEVGAVNEYRGKLKTARVVEAVAGVVGGVAGGMGSAYAFKRIDALQHGVKLGSHVIKHVGGATGDWYQVINNADIQKAADLAHATHGAGHTLNVFSHPGSFGEISNSVVNTANAQHLNLFHVNGGAGQWGSDGLFHGIEGYFDGAVGAEIWNQALRAGLEGGVGGFITGEISGIRRANQAKRVAELGNHGATALYDDNHAYKRPRSEIAGPIPPVIEGSGDASTASSTAEGNKAKKPEDKSFYYQSLEKGQEEKIRNAVTDLITTGDKEVQADTIQKIFLGYELGKDVPKGELEYPRDIRQLLGFGEENMSRNDFLRTIEDALTCAWDAANDMDEREEKEPGTLNDVEKARLTSLKDYISRLKQLTEITNDFVPMDLSLRDHIRYAIEKDTKENIELIEGVKSKSTYDKGSNRDALLKELVIAEAQLTGNTSPEKLRAMRERVNSYYILMSGTALKAGPGGSGGKKGGGQTSEQNRLMNAAQTAKELVDYITNRIEIQEKKLEK